MISLETIIFLAPAFVAGAIIAIAHVPLGLEVLRRGIIFLDLAVAQFAAMGMMAFSLLPIDEYSWLGMIGPLASGLLAALACAFVFHFLEKRSGQYQEALIGCAFVLSASISLLIMANNPHGDEAMQNILAGQILWTDWTDLKIAAPVFILIGVLWAVLKNRRKLFYPLFALAIPFAVHLIGVYLVFASLIIPALGAQSWPETHKVFVGYLISIAAIILGLGFSVMSDTPTGPTIVCAFSIVAVMFWGLRRKWSG